MVKPIRTLTEVTEYRVSICGRSGCAGNRSITITFEGIDARRNLLGIDGRGEAKAEDTIREAVEHMLPPHASVGRISRLRRRAVPSND
jgi:hypothetical protein